MKLAFHDRPQDRFLALGVRLINHLARPHSGHGATEMRVSRAAPEHGDQLNWLNTATVAAGGMPLVRP